MGGWGHSTWPELKGGWDAGRTSFLSCHSGDEEEETLPSALLPWMSSARCLPHSPVSKLKRACYKEKRMRGDGIFKHNREGLVEQKLDWNNSALSKAKMRSRRFKMEYKLASMASNKPLLMLTRAASVLWKYWKPDWMFSLSLFLKEIFCG